MYKTTTMPCIQRRKWIHCLFCPKILMLLEGIVTGNHNNKQRKLYLITIITFQWQMLTGWLV